MCSVVLTGPVNLECAYVLDPLKQRATGAFWIDICTEPMNLIRRAHCGAVRDYLKRDGLTPRKQEILWSFLIAHGYVATGVEHDYCLV